MSLAKGNGYARVPGAPKDWGVVTMRRNAKTLEERCEARCPRETPWSREAKAYSGILRIQNIKTRCTLKKGHTGPHLGLDDTEWED